MCIGSAQFVVEMNIGFSFFKKSTLCLLFIEQCFGTDIENINIFPKVKGNLIRINIWKLRGVEEKSELHIFYRLKNTFN